MPLPTITISFEDQEITYDLIETENAIVCEKKPADFFMAGTLRSVDLGEHVKAIVGKLKTNPESLEFETQSHVFEKPYWNQESVKMWLQKYYTMRNFKMDDMEELKKKFLEDKKGTEEHIPGKNPASWVADEALWEKAKSASEKAFGEIKYPFVAWLYDHWGGERTTKSKQEVEPKKYNSDLKSIEGVEIFSAGKWNGDIYTEADLDKMVSAFNENHQTCRPALKLGHDNAQKILQADGYPAAGWIGKLYRQGSKLVADFIDIPSKIYELIKKKAYRNVSSEIFWNIDVNGKKYDRMLSAVALLGADMPAVSNLKDMLALYGISGEAKKTVDLSQNGLSIKSYSFKNGGHKMEEIEKLQKEMAALQEQLKEKETAESDLKKYKEDADKRIADLESKAQDAEIEKQVSDLVGENLVSVAMKPYVKSFLESEKKSYSFQEGEKQVELSRADVLKKILQMHTDLVKLNTKEYTVKSDGEDKDMHKKIEKYAADNKCDYKTAYKAVMKDKK